jgi:RNA polymerase sigma-70 factor (sigma-E family)
VRADEDEDFRQFVAAEMDSLRRLAYLTCGNWQAADDAVSTGLAKLYLSWHKVSAPHWYARRVVVNAAVDEVRRPWRREHLALPEVLDRSIPDPAAEVAERDRIQQALLKIPPGQRKVLLLRFYEDLSVEDTAAILGKSTGTIKSQTARGLAALHRVLGDAPWGESEYSGRFASVVRRG